MTIVIYSWFQQFILSLLDHWKKVGNMDLSLHSLHLRSTNIGQKEKCKVAAIILLTSAHCYDINILPHNR